MALHINEPHLFLTYQQDGQQVRIGPFYSASPYMIDIQTGEITYKVINAHLTLQHVAAPRYHSLTAIIDPDTKMDI